MNSLEIIENIIKHPETEYIYGKGKISYKGTSLYFTDEDNYLTISVQDELEGHTRRKSLRFYSSERDAVRMLWSNKINLYCLEEMNLMPTPVDIAKVRNG